MVFDKIVDNLLFLALCDPQYRTGQLIDDVDCVLVPFMQEKLVDTENKNCSFGPLRTGIPFSVVV